MSTSDLANLVSRLEAAVQRLEKRSGGTSGGAGDQGEICYWLAEICLCILRQPTIIIKSK